MDERYEPRTDWKNIGLFWDWIDFGVSTPWGNLIFKRWRDRLFTDRDGYTPTLKVFGLCVTWVRLKRFRDPLPHCKGTE